MKTFTKEILSQKAFNGKSIFQNLYDFWNKAYYSSIEHFSSSELANDKECITFCASKRMKLLVKEFVENQNLQDSEGVNLRWVRVNRMELLIIDNKICIRFKKIYSDYSTRNVETQQVKQFKSQELTLLDCPELLSLDFGYRSNKFGMEIEGIYLICSKNTRENEWILTASDLSETDEEQLFKLEEEHVINVLNVKPQFRKQNERASS